MIAEYSVTTTSGISPTEFRSKIFNLAADGAFYPLMGVTFPSSGINATDATEGKISFRV